jgi:hypothetical protein
MHRPEKYIQSSLAFVFFCCILGYWCIAAFWCSLFYTGLLDGVADYFIRIGDVGLLGIGIITLFLFYWINSAWHSYTDGPKKFKTALNNIDSLASALFSGITNRYYHVHRISEGKIPRAHEEATQKTQEYVLALVHFTYKLYITHSVK